MQPVCLNKSRSSMEKASGSPGIKVSLKEWHGWVCVASSPDIARRV